MARNTMETWLREEQGSDVIKRLAQTSVAETALRSEPMSGTTKSIPRMGSMDVEVIAKGAAYGEDTAQNDEVNLTARKFGKALRIAEEDIDDNLVNVLEVKKTDWVTSFGIALDNAVFGTSTAENGGTVPFTSIYRALNTANAATGYTAGDNVLTSDGALTGSAGYDKLSDLASAVEDGAYADPSRMLFVAHPSIKGALRKLKDENGNPLFAPSMTAGQADTLFGYPIRFTAGAVVSTAVSGKPAVVRGGGTKGAAGNPLIFFGNTELAVVGKRSGPESVVIDGKDGLSALTDETILKVRARRAFVLAHEAGWAVLEVTAGA